LTVEFTTLSKPIEIKDPVEAKFTEYHVYSDVVLHVAKSTMDSVIGSGLTTDSFVLREILQNAVDNEILKTKDFLWAYKNVPVKKVGKWKVIESEGTLDEDVFLIGFSTKEQMEGTPCRLVGRYGVGLKESIFVMLYLRRHLIMIFGGHIYGFGYYYKGKVYYDLDYDTISANVTKINPVILRGTYNVTDKVIVYVPADVESAIEITYPFEKPYHVNPGDVGLVYHNGIYSGKWLIPLDINVCNVNTDQYRAMVYFDKTLVDSLNMIADDEMAHAFKKIILRNIFASGKVVVIGFSVWMSELYNRAEGKLREVLQNALNMAVEDVAGQLHEKVLIVDRVSVLTSKDMVAIALPDIAEDYINNVRSYLAGKGYKVFAYSEALSGKLMELYDQIAETKVDDAVKAFIKLGEWLYSIGVEIMAFMNIPGWIERAMPYTENFPPLLDPLPGIFDIPVKVVKPEYNDLLSDAVGVTLKVNNQSVILLRNLPPNQWVLYAGITIHELNHLFTKFSHGSYEWENIYNVLYLVDDLSPYASPYIRNLVRLAFYNPRLFLKINNVAYLPPLVLPTELIESESCRGYLEEKRILCDDSSPYTLKLIVEDGKLKLEVVEE